MTLNVNNCVFTLVLGGLGASIIISKERMVKVVFLEDVPNVAETGEVKEVADGYARNFLIPKKLAVLADSRVTHLVEARLKKKARLQAETEAEMRELARQGKGRRWC